MTSAAASWQNCTAWPPTGTPIPIGTDARRHALRVWHYPHDADYANAIGAQPDRTSYLRDGQPARTAASGDKHEILAR
ncbi:hypothetical protein RMA73_16855 [Xanthomonas translucens pv. translucens]|uniref:hypothetical protein n=1 Tax=Xanthomonas campestris pv. translucens TaxID=343 RepID=UPI00288A37B9|nr:hypothetical protein [Xanthomonas translucens]WNJ26484.1 hypothetical protein RMA73_16855 [Xanthomonas translucens pv. translucens]